MAITIVNAILTLCKLILICMQSLHTVYKTNIYLGRLFFCEIFSRGGKYEDDGLLGC